MNSKEFSSGLERGWQKILAFFHGVTNWFTSYGRRLVHGIENYLKSKTKNFPVSPPKSRRRVIEILGKDPVFLEAIRGFARETGFSAEEVLEKGKAYLKEIVSDLNYLTGPFWDLLLSWVFNKLYEGISIDQEYLNRLHEKVGKVPIVFVPNHRSHIDYLLLSYVLYSQRLPLPYVCAGNNMNFWPAGSLFRKSGAFFIRRSFEGNRLYQAALYAYLHYLLKEKSLMEFFIEGTRSRTGKLLPPRLGILSLLAKAFQEQEDIPDIAFVPTSLAYESIIEEKHYIDEHEGAKKPKESFWDLFRLRKYLRGQYGKVYLRFGEPISLKAFQAEVTQSEGELSGAGGARRPLDRLSQTQPKDAEGDRTRPPEDLVLRLADLLSYSINRSTIVTPSSLVAMSLLSHPKLIITEGEIEARFDRYLEYLKKKEVPLSDWVAQRPDDSIRSSLLKYSRSHMIRPYRDEEGAFYRIEPARRKVLEYYKNTGVHFFVSAAAVSMVLLTAKEHPISLSDIESEITFLKDLFSFEFSFSRRKALSEHIEAVLKFLQKKEAVTVHPEKCYSPGPQSIWLDEFRALLNSTFSIYWAVLMNLRRLPNREWSEEELTNLLLTRTRLRLLRHNLMRQEALSLFIIKNTLRAYTRLKILGSRKETKEKKTHVFYKVSANAETFQQVLQHLERYLNKS